MTTTSVYPGALDTFAAHGATMDQVEEHENLHLTMEDAIEKIEVELGTNPSGSSATVAERIADLEPKVLEIANTTFSAPAGSSTVNWTVESTDDLGIFTAPNTTVTLPLGNWALAWSGSANWPAGSSISINADGTSYATLISGNARFLVAAPTKRRSGTVSASIFVGGGAGVTVSCVLVATRVGV